MRLEGSTRTIAIPMDHDLLKNTKSVVPALCPLCSDVEGETLKGLDDVALSSSIAGLALRVSISVLHFSVYYVQNLGSVFSALPLSMEAFSFLYFFFVLSFYDCRP